MQNETQQKERVERPMLIEERRQYVPGIIGREGRVLVSELPDSIGISESLALLGPPTAIHLVIADNTIKVADADTIARGIEDIRVVAPRQPIANYDLTLHAGWRT